MRQIASLRDAKDYLAGRIADEADRQDIQLSEIERKMLYFSEIDWTLPGMLEINAEFERDYDQNEYERKIVGLVRAIEAEDRTNAQSRRLWDQAVEKLNEGDNYLSIMLDPSFSPKGATVRPPHDRLKLWLTALVIVFGALGLLGLLTWMFGPKLWTLQDWLSDHRSGGLPGLILMAVMVLFWLARAKLSSAFISLLNRKKTGDRAG